MNEMQLSKGRLGITILLFSMPTQMKAEDQEAKKR